MKRNRWLIALSAMGLHLCIGSVYAWSVLTKPIMESMGFTLKETTWTFSLAILFLGLSAGFLGSFVQKIGPRKSGLLSMTCFVTAMFGTAAALYAHSLPMLYAFYGVIGGIGLGTGYITPVSTLVKWFPENRGFATGLAIMGFGFASLIAGPAMQLLVQHFGLVANFIIISCYGGGFSCMSAYLSDLFGTKYLSAIHGRILTAWGAAGVAGPLVLSLIKENTNSYAVTLYFFVGAFVAALALMIFLKYRTRHGIARVAEARG